MYTTKKDMSGSRFGRLLVLKESEKRVRGCVCWEAQCDCGVVKTYSGAELRKGRTNSCGCLARELSSKRATTHGKKGTTIYRIWSGMMDRCNNPNSADWNNYGGRGITVCDEWHKFENFYRDMGDRPKMHSVDRIDVNKGYSPENCRWATNKEQQNNRRNNRMLTYNGKTQTMSKWASDIGISFACLWRRIRAGWSIEQALTTPINALK